MFARLLSLACASVVPLAACSGTSVAELSGPTGARCQTSFGTAIPAVPAAGTRLDIAVVAARECSWTAASDASWVLVSPASGQGDATLTVSVSANPQGRPRSATLTLNNERAVLTQAPAPCEYALSAASARIPSAGGTIAVEVTATSGCDWTTSSPAGWLTVTPRSHAGSSAVAIEVQPNQGGARSATVAIAERPFAVTQEAFVPAPAPSPGGPAPSPPPAPAPGPSPGPMPPAGCSYSIEPLTATVAPREVKGEVRVTAPAHCRWEAASDASWIRITSAAAGAGTAEVKYQVDRNRSPLMRIGTIAVAGHTHTVLQEGRREGDGPEN